MMLYIFFLLLSPHFSKLPRNLPGCVLEPYLQIGGLILGKDGRIGCNLVMIPRNCIDRSTCIILTFNDSFHIGARHMSHDAIVVTNPIMKSYAI